MNTNLIKNTISQLICEIEKSKNLKERKIDKYKSTLKKLHKNYSDVNITDEFKRQYNQLNSKGIELVKEIKNLKDKDKLESNIEIYIRYLKASLCDFKGQAKNLRKYITSFLFSAILFLALSPQFYGFILPILFFIPIYIGLKGVKKRSINGFYMTMSLVPVSLMTSFTWIRYGMNVISDYTSAVTNIVNSGISENLAKNLVYIGPIFGLILLIFATMQLYRGYKSRDLFI